MILMNLQDASAYVGVSKRTLMRRIAQKTIAFYRIGRLIRIAKKDLDVYLKLQRVEAE